MPFIDEDELSSFDGWLRYQAIDSMTLSSEQRVQWLAIFEKVQARAQSTPKVGAMNFSARESAGSRFAIAIEKESTLYLALWIRRARKGDIYVFYPHGADGGNSHSSYHVDGRYHHKVHGRKFPIRRGQALNESFRGTEHLGSFSGFGPRSNGAICIPGSFTSVVQVPDKILGPRNGHVNVDLLEPGGVVSNLHVCLPNQHVVLQSVFDDEVPRIAVTVIADNS